MNVQDAILSLVSMQHRLLKAYRDQFPEVSLNGWLLGVPSRVDLNLDQETWRATRHGAGISFMRTSPIPHLVVDMHVDVGCPDRVDAWRLQQYVESLGGSIDYKDAEEQLLAAVAAGLLKRDSETGYRLP